MTQNIPARQSLIADQLARAELGDPALTEWALAVADAIPYDDQRGQMLAQIYATTRNGTPDELSHWRVRPLGDSIDLLNAFL